MPDLTYQIEGVKVEPYAMTPTLAFQLRLTNSDGGVSIHSVALRCQIQIETTRRRYEPAEQERLLDLFGEPERWNQTLRTMLWTNVSCIVPQFSTETVVDLQVPCSFDFNVASTKYFAGLAQGEVPLCFLFSGTIFYQTDDTGLQVTQIPWDKEVNYRLPVPVWRQMIDAYYPNTAWLCLHRDVFDRLNRYKMLKSIPTWEQALENLLLENEETDLRATEAKTIQ